MRLCISVEKRIKYTKFMERYFILEIPWPRAPYSKSRNMKFIDPGSIICIGIINTTLILYYIDKSYFCIIQGKFLDCIQSRAEAKIQKNLIGWLRCIRSRFSKNSPHQQSATKGCVISFLQYSVILVCNSQILLFTFCHFVMSSVKFLIFQRKSFDRRSELRSQKT